jgi:hypothetical protein
LFMLPDKKNYFDKRKEFLIAKRDREVLAYSDAAFAYVRRIAEINQEIQDLDDENKKEK